jgi:transposase-like protein
MPNILHANAKTTPRIRKEIQESEKSISELAQTLNLNVKTIKKWKDREGITDKKSGPKHRKSVLTELEQMIICEVRQRLLLPLDELFIVLKPHMDKLTRSNLHRCLQHYGLSKLQKNTKERDKKVFKTYDIGFVHIDITEVWCADKKHYLFVGIERSTKYIYVELHENMTQAIAVSFLRNMQAECVFKITHVLTDNGAQFSYNCLVDNCKPKNKIHPFIALCQELGIENRTTQFRHPWTNGQVEISNKTIKNATTKKFHYADIETLKKHLMAYILYYNYQKPLKSKKYKTPWQLIEEKYIINPEKFVSNPNHKIAGLNK